MIDLTYENYYDFGQGNENTNLDFKVLASNISDNYDVLIFTDSKGTSIGGSRGKEWTSQIIDSFERNQITFLFISRPKETTIFFTLLNFLNLNNIQFGNLISNLGFVDFTPKKEKFIDDILMQNPFQNQKLLKYEICDYKLNSGDMAKLFSVNYLALAKDIADTIQKKFNKIFLLGTFEFNSKIIIERKRPLEFYNQLKETNKFIELICSYYDQFIFINVNTDLPKNGFEFSYDAVHFTQSGHNKTANLCFKHI
ncbi:hypothetical protein OAO25_01005 [Flavobacteriaceae bacterium]|nr:hypothetical protein [Flavobacteriaceae bacterium]